MKTLRAVVLLSVLLSLGPAGFAQQANLLRNGAFDGAWLPGVAPAAPNAAISLPEGWTLEIGKTSAAVRAAAETRDLPPEAQVRHALRVTTDAPFTLRQDLDLEPGAAYRISLWCNLVKGFNPIISVDPVRDDRVRRDFYMVYTAIQTPGWSRCVVDFPAGPVPRHRVALAFAKSGPDTLECVVAGVRVEKLDLTAMAAPVEKGGPRDYRFAGAFDFGGLLSPVREGYAQVTPMTLYRPERGYGFESNHGLAAIEDWGRAWGIPGNALSDDAVWVKCAETPSADHVFRADIPNGDYFVRLLVSGGPHFEVSANGGEPLAVKCPMSYNVIAPVVLRARVADGVLRVRFKSLPTTSTFYNGWICHAMTVYPAADRVRAVAQADRDEAQIFLAKSRTSAPWSARTALAPPPQRPLEPTPEETARGFALFTRSATGGTQYLGPVFPETVPDESERAGRLSLRATPGEREPVFLGIHPLKDAVGVPVSATELKDAAGTNVIARDCVSLCDIGFLRFRWRAGGSQFTEADVQDWPGFIAALRAQAAAPGLSPAKEVLALLSDEVSALLSAQPADKPVDAALLRRLIAELNTRVLTSTKLCDRSHRAAWQGVTLGAELTDLLRRHDVDLVLTDQELPRLNRLLIEAAWPGRVAASPKENAHALQPVLLTPVARMDLYARESRGLWITVRVPDSAKPGLYTGSVSVGGVAVPVALDVLPFTLPDPPDATWQQFYTWPNAARAEEELADMRAHGMNAVELHLENGLDAKARAGQPLTQMEQRLQLAVKHGLTHPLVCGQFNTPVLSFDTRDPKFAFTPEREKTVVDCTRYVQSRFSGRGYPEMLFYAVDEPNAPHLRKTAARLYELIKSVPGARTFVTCTPESLEPMKPFIDIRCYTKGAANLVIDPAAVAAGGAAFWQYMPNYCHQPGSARRYPGFTMWARRCTGTLWWHYNDYGNTGSVYNGVDGIGDYLWRWPAMEGGWVSTLGWELTREGIDDCKYCRLLERRIAEVRRSGDARAQRAEAIAADLERLRADLVRAAPPAANTWTGVDYDRTRARIIAWILELL